MDLADDPFLESISHWQQKQDQIEVEFLIQSIESTKAIWEQFQSQAIEECRDEIESQLEIRRKGIFKLIAMHEKQSLRLSHNEELKELQELAGEILTHAAAQLRFDQNLVQESETGFEEKVSQNFNSKIAQNILTVIHSNQWHQRPQNSIIWLSNYKILKAINFKTKTKFKWSLEQRVPTLFGIINLPKSCIIAGGVLRVRPRGHMKKDAREIEVNKAVRYLAPMLSTRMKFALAFHQPSQCVFALGGCQRIRLLKQLKTVNVYRRAQNKWKAMLEMPDSEPNGGACLVKNTLYYFYSKGRRQSNHLIAMRLDLQRRRTTWQIIGIMAYGQRMPTKLEALLLPGVNEICIQDTRKKEARIMIINKKGDIVHSEEKDIVDEEIRLRKLFYKSRGHSLFRINRNNLFEFDRGLRAFKQFASVKTVSKK